VLQQPGYENKNLLQPVTVGIMVEYYGLRIGKIKIKFSIDLFNYNYHTNIIQRLLFITIETIVSSDGRL